MRTRDPDDKRRRLMEAALAEFATYGVAGARVDRLAKRAGISPGLVYSFFDGKDGLFEAVYDGIVELTVATMPIDGDDLPAYAGSLYDAARDHPEVMRFLAWYALERGDTQEVRPVAAKSMADKVAVIAEAQQRGTVTGRMPAEQILALVLSIANMFSRPAEDVRSLVPEPDRRRTVVESVRQLITP